MLRTPSPLILLTLFAAACGGDNPPPEPKPGAGKIISFTASAASVEAGSEVTLTWETEDTTGVLITPRVGLKGPSGSAVDTPLVTTTYVLTVPAGAEDLRAEVTVEVAGAPRVASFEANPRTIMPGESATLSWTTTDADDVNISPDVGVQGAQGSVEVTPETTTTYQLVARRADGMSQPREVTVVVASGNQPFITKFQASAQSIQAGDTVTLSWETANTDRVTISEGIGEQTPNGQIDVMPSQTTTYTLSAVGPGGRATASVTVTVIAGGDPEVVKFEANPDTIAPGGQTELSWDTNNAESVVIDNGVGSQPAKGSFMVTPGQTTTYTLRAIGVTSEATAQVTVTVAGANQPVIVSFAASPSAILEGGSTTLTWTTQNADSVDVDNNVGTGLGPNDSASVNPIATTTYTLTARNANGTAMATTSVTVSPPPATVVSFTATPISITAGQSTLLEWDTTNSTGVSIDNGVGAQGPNGSASVSPTQNTTYVLTATGPGGDATAQVSVTVAAVGAPTIVSFTATPQQIAPGGQTTLSWAVQDATTVEIDNGIGTQNLSGTINVSPSADTTYTLSATGPGGQTNAQVTVAVVAVVGDTCADAFVVTGSGMFSGNTNVALDDYSDPRVCTGFSASGPDIVYSIALQPGDRLEASLAPAAGMSWDTSLYLVTNCANIGQSCVAGQDNGNPEEIDYTAIAAGDYFLVVDGFAGQGGDYDLDITITPAPIANDVCGGAIDISNGGTFNGDTNNANDDYTPIASGLGGCTGFSANSNDLTYSVALAAGERLQATMTAAWDASLYLVQNCSDVANTCVAGQDNGNPEEIDYTATTAGTYFLIADGYGTARGSYTLDVTISPPVTGGDVCEAPVVVPAGGGSFQSTTLGLTNDYDPPTSCTGFSAAGPDRAYRVDVGAGDVVEVSADFVAGVDGAIYVVEDCNAITSCVAGADSTLGGDTEFLRFAAMTNNPHFLIVDSFDTTGGDHDLTVTQYTGEVCAEGAPLDIDNASEWFTNAGKANDYSPNSGGCTGFSAAGPDRVYTVAVSAGDQVHVTVDPDNFDASLYMVSDCTDINGSCLAGSDVGVSSDEEIAPVFQQSGTYYVVVDAFGSTGGTGTLAAEIRRGDTCADAYVVPADGGTFEGTTAGYGTELGTSSGSGSCTNFSQSGKDAVYAVSIPAGQTLNASVTTTWDSALYLVSDCDNSDTTCVAGEDNGTPEEISYQNSGSSAETYYLVVDSWLDSTQTTNREGNYTLTISFQ